MTSQLHLISFFHTNLFLRGVQHDWDRNQQRFDKNLINPAYLRYVHNETFGCYWKHSSWGFGLLFFKLLVSPSTSNCLEDHVPPSHLSDEFEEVCRPLFQTILMRSLHGNLHLSRMHETRANLPYLWSHGERSIEYLPRSQQTVWGLFLCAVFVPLRLFLSLVQPVALCASHVSIYGLLSPFSASFVYVPRLSRGKHTQLLLITPFQVCVVQA